MRQVADMLESARLRHPRREPSVNNPPPSSDKDSNAQGDLLKERKKAGDEVVDIIHQLMKHWEKRHDILSERFGNGKLRAFIHFSRIDSIEERGVRYDPELSIKSNATHQVVISNCEQGTVLVDIITFVEFPQVIVPIFVRLDAVDFTYRFGTHTFEFSNLRDFVTPGAITNGKANLLAGLDSRTAYEHKLINQMIEGASKVLDNVSSNGNQSERSNGDLNRFINMTLPRFRILLGSDYIQITLAKFRSVVFKFSEMLSRPFDLNLNKNHSFIGRQGHSHRLSCFQLNHCTLSIPIVSI